MTYDLLQLQDYQMLDVLAAARRHGALVMVHAENYDMIRWLSDRLLESGHWQPQYHAVSHSRAGEGEATHRAIALAKLIDVPMLVVHVSAEEAMSEIRKAQDAGLKIYGETCPQYLFLTAEDLERDGMEGAKFCCSPPPRDTAAQEAIWRGLKNGTFQVFFFRSRALPFRRDRQAARRARTDLQADRQWRAGDRAAPALALLRRGRQRAHRHSSVRRLDGHQRRQTLWPAPQEGHHRSRCRCGPGDLGDPEKEVTVTWDDLHDDVGYTPYEGKQLKGWPVTVLSRGKVLVDQGELNIEAGSGEFLPRRLSDAAQPLGKTEAEMDPARNFGAAILPQA